MKEYIMQESNLYFTHDLGTAVYLFSSGYELVKTELLSPKRLQFFFTRKATTDIDVVRYLNGQAKAPAKLLFDNYRALRALTFQKTGNVR
jgi:hypothetical protein